MTFRIEAITVLPALFLFMISSYLAFLTFQIVDSSIQETLAVMAFCLLLGGLILTVCWGYYWGIHKRFQESKGNVISQTLSLSTLIGFFLIFFGSITLVWVGYLTWYDITVWGKGITLIFFESRTGENISLGIGMKVIHYFFIGLALLLSGFVTFIRRRLRKCPYHFGYLVGHPEKDPIPKKCLVCLRVADCMAIKPTRISGQPQKQKPLVKSATKKEKDSKCSHHFGYLRDLPDNQAVPHECVTCQKLLECRNLI